MGGLDARRSARRPGRSGRVLSLTTIGTPHLGSALADFAKIGFGRVYRLLQTLRIDHWGFLDLTRRRRRRGQPHGARRPPASPASASPATRPPRRLPAAPPLHESRRPEGPNDGLVSVESALAFGEPLPAWPIDHLRQVGWLARRRARRASIARSTST